MIKIGTKVLHKKTLEEHVLVNTVRVTGNRVWYTFESTEKDTLHLENVPEDELEEKYHFLVENHPSVHDQDRKKDKKKRIKMSPPSLVSGRLN